ncbi:MAG TPA: hypothetical protein VFC78_24080 [Tepidisphaeraceae bacterium]|nr:hypothetical protein [Tepidisphaeraceae bacterium]
MEIIRNPKSVFDPEAQTRRETNSKAAKAENPKGASRSLLVLRFRPLNFEFVSDFVLRISDFPPFRHFAVENVPRRQFTVPTRPRPAR